MLSRKICHVLGQEMVWTVTLLNAPCNPNGFTVSKVLLWRSTSLQCSNSSRSLIIQSWGKVTSRWMLAWTLPRAPNSRRMRARSTGLSPESLPRCKSQRRLCQNLSSETIHIFTFDSKSWFQCHIFKCSPVQPGTVKSISLENRNWTTTVNDLSTIVNDCQRFNLSIDFLYLMMRGPVDQRRSFALERKSRHTLTLPNVWDWWCDVDGRT